MKRLLTLLLFFNTMLLLLQAQPMHQIKGTVIDKNSRQPLEFINVMIIGLNKFRLKKGQRLRAVGAAILSMLAAAPPGDNHWEYTCGQCQRTFEVPVAKFPSSEEKEEE